MASEEVDEPAARHWTRAEITEWTAQPGTLQALARFFRHVEVTDTCWLWRAAKDGDGYGKFHLDGTTGRAHRVVYAWLLGPVA